ncbi:hypothetical protein TNCT_708891 [Trichonephila clavata]|uniref:Uncharacterized protein n=1 Tax=Trichonephila clavata TaxID=2740835 RepID=A0A8X6GM47_TRICU|nr:hypothetical protein TNCT_708891 [Trichonephila clavata]
MIRRMCPQYHLVAEVIGAESTEEMFGSISSDAYSYSKTAVHQSRTLIAQETLIFAEIKVFLFETRFIRIFVAQRAQKRRQMNFFKHSSTQRFKIIQTTRQLSRG